MPELAYFQDLVSQVSECKVEETMKWQEVFATLVYSPYLNASNLLPPASACCDE